MCLFVYCFSFGKLKVEPLLVVVFLPACVSCGFEKRMNDSHTISNKRFIVNRSMRHDCLYNAASCDQSWHSTERLKGIFDKRFVFDNMGCRVTFYLVLPRQDFCCWIFIQQKKSLFNYMKFLLLPPHAEDARISSCLQLNDALAVFLLRDLVLDRLQNLLFQHSVVTLQF